VNRDILIIADNEEIKHRIKTSKMCAAKMLRTLKLSMSRLRNPIFFPYNHVLREIINTDIAL